MKKIFYALLLMIGINTAQAQEVPLLDRGLFFGNPEI